MSVLEAPTVLDRPHAPQMDAWPVLRVCGLPVAAVSLADTARAMVDYCCGEGRRAALTPLFMTSVNGQVLSMCGSDPAVHRAFAQADAIHCDGQPLVLLSRAMGPLPLPERVATTDLFPETARLAAERGLSFYFLGATPEVNRKAVEAVRAAYPDLAIAGASHGYLSGPEEDAVVADIARLRPDILWIAMGVPREQEFFLRHRNELRGVGIVKTSGGLFDFLADEKARAPRWMQAAGFEWLFRLMLEPRRLFVRYLVTNPHALYLMVKSLRPGRGTAREA